MGEVDPGSYSDPPPNGCIGNNGSLETDFSKSIANCMPLPSGAGAFRNGATGGLARTAFDPSLSKVNSYDQGSSSGGYTVRAGETLASIAANLWGDSSLWYKLAEANGLSAQAALSEGQSIRIPAGVMKNTHNASTFQPYDPSETIGDTAPTAAKPPKKNKCGAFGQVLLVVVAVAVAAVVAPYAAAAFANTFGAGAVVTAAGATSTLAAGTAVAATAAGISAGTISVGIGASIAGGAVAGAAASMASQALGVATGIQDKFSWTSVASSALAGGLGGAGKLGVGGSSIGSNAARAMVSNVLSQGASIALGPQSKFSWASVAAAGVGSWAGGKFGASKFGQVLASSSTIAGQIGTGTAAAIANAATRTALGDGNFGDNIRAAIPDVIGQALGNALVGGIGSIRQNGIDEHARLGSSALSSSGNNLSPSFGSGTPNLDTIGSYSLPPFSEGTELLISDTPRALGPPGFVLVQPLPELTEGFWTRLVGDVAKWVTIPVADPPASAPMEQRPNNWLKNALGRLGARALLLSESGAVATAAGAPSVLAGTIFTNRAIGIHAYYEGGADGITPLLHIPYNDGRRYSATREPSVDDGFRLFVPTNLNAVLPTTTSEEHGLSNTLRKAGLNDIQVSTILENRRVERKSTSQLSTSSGREENVGELVPIGKNRVTFQGLEVRAVRDLSHLSDSTLKLMSERGFAGKTVDGQSIILHHHRQNPDGFIVELPASKHSIGNVNQHPYGNTKGRGLTAEQRAAFDTWRESYWKARAQSELQRRSGQ